MKTNRTTLAPELKSLVHEAVALLGEVIQKNVGAVEFRRIEQIRRQMTSVRHSSHQKAYVNLRGLYAVLAELTPAQRRHVATAYTLMLELINVCENVYRSYRLQEHKQNSAKTDQVAAIVYVLTAHPTEARAPQNIYIFHQIQDRLLLLLKSGRERIFSSEDQTALRHLFEVAWRISIVRERIPQVKDEAEHIYSMLFRADIFATLLELSQDGMPFYLRTWVGGDKDGHPGVNEKTLLQSLTLSRNHLVRLCLLEAKELQKTLDLLSHATFLRGIRQIEKNFRHLKILKHRDAQRIIQLREKIRRLAQSYGQSFGAIHPSLLRLRQVFRLFPGLVVPLELRESSDVLMAPPTHKKLAIEKMLRVVHRLAGQAEPLWYARGFIISMTESIQHIQQAAKFQKKVFAGIPLPIIPLFEQAQALENSSGIVQEMLQDKEIKNAIQRNWNNQVEMMVGYSDSSKESGALFSRLTISKALPLLEKVCEKGHVLPVFFHGSGGSVDRGGGSVEDQTAWWPRSALRYYKVTVQGEMVERSFATPEITRGQIQHISDSLARGLKNLKNKPPSKALDRFARMTAQIYHEQITSESFLEMVEKATPYSYLHYLKIGSRPVKRGGQLTVAGLRAIPWILCWTQTRVLFPTWWGLGSAWLQMSATERAHIQKDFRELPVFQSYIKALGFTLAKIELPIFRIYLEQSSLTPARAQEVYNQFDEEMKRVQKFFRELTHDKGLTWEKPWLGESITLRSPMIHPLNLLQILAEKEKDIQLLRITATGISSGMLTTG